MSARYFFEKLAIVLKKCGFEKCVLDPCVFTLKKGGVLVAICVTYVDDILIAGDPKMVPQIKEDIMRQEFTIKDLGLLNKHLGIWYEFGRDEAGSYYDLSMKGFADSLIEDYGKYIGKEVQRYETPAYGRESICKGQEEEDAIDPDKYRSFVGRAMWFVRKVRPGACNAIRELATYMQKPVKQHWRALDRLIGYLANDPGKKLRIREPRTLSMFSYSDSTFGSDPDDRLSVTGNITTMGGTLLSMTSKKQQTVTLSSTEAEYTALAATATEAVYAKSLAEEILGFSLDRTVIYEDNTGAIYLANNEQVGVRTKHVSIKVHYTRQLIRENQLFLQYVKSANNYADLCTKNLGNEDFHKFNEGIHGGEIPIDLQDAASRPNREDVKQQAHVCVGIRPRRDCECERARKSPNSVGNLLKRAGYTSTKTSADLPTEKRNLVARRQWPVPKVSRKESFQAICERVIIDAHNSMGAIVNNAALNEEKMLLNSARKIMAGLLTLGYKANSEESAIRPIMSREDNWLYANCLYERIQSEWLLCDKDLNQWE